LHAGNKRPAGCRKVLLVLYRLFVYGSFIPLLFKEGLQKNSPFFTDGQTAYSFVPGLAVVFFVGADSTLNRFVRHGALEHICPDIKISRGNKCSARWYCRFAP
jgi:hypothetical protein